MSTTRTLPAAAAEALLGLLPTTEELHAEEYNDGGALGSQVSAAVVASFVGAASADVAVVLADPAALATATGTDSPFVSSADLARPALEAATSVIGPGVLSNARQEDAQALFADPDSAVFRLAGRTGGTGGWFAIRVREDGTVNASRGSHGSGSNHGMEDSVMGKLGRINNVEMALTVEIGRTRMSVRDVLNLEPGGVIELDRSAGAPADVLLNGRLIAHGEVVVVDQDYAVRITRILDVAEGLS
jgi:flagellar motor switch protein FliN/FliY